MLVSRKRVGFTRHVPSLPQYAPHWGFSGSERNARSIDEDPEGRFASTHHASRAVRWKIVYELRLF